jgi:glycosyltransferase involved in cell wall biosynthesis
VLSVAYPLAPVGPDAVGGTEQVLVSLDAALTAAGHTSLVIACRGSRVTGTLLETELPPPPYDPHAQRIAQERHRRALAEALERWHVDVVHFHGLDFAAYLPVAVPLALPLALDVPHRLSLSTPATVATLHLPIAAYGAEALRAHQTGVSLVCVSRAQWRDYAATGGSAVVIENGVTIPDAPPRTRRRAFALALGRVCPEKGLHLAVAAARRAGIPLLIAGRVFPYPDHQRYFAEVLAPTLDQQRRFIGAAGPDRKRRLLASARCIVVPSLIAETSSLVAMEALAAGTPVVARAVGALPDIVEPGRTGFLADSVEDLSIGMLAAADLRGDECRQVARVRFNVATTTGQYLALYDALACGRAAAVPYLSQEPRARVAGEAAGDG